MKQFYNRLLAVAVVALVALGAHAAIPAGYYKSLYGKSGQALKDAIHELAIQHTKLGYNSLWHHFPATDHYPDNVTKVWDMYSDKDYYFNGTNSVSGMNKEHSFPKSWWGGDDDVLAYTDLNHLYPSDGPANMAKSNYPMGAVSSTNVKGGFDNNVSKVGSPVAGQGGGSSLVFEPDDRYKGDFARTYFYMACAYQDYNWVHTYMVHNYSSGWQTLNPWAVTLLINWARQDPVSTKETNRNDEVQKHQNNRNPFIDFPALFEYIWGSKQGEVFNGDDENPDPTPIGEPVLVSPTQGSVLDMGEVALGKSLTAILYVKGENLTNSLSVLLYKDAQHNFSIPVSSIDRTVANSEDGYPLQVTYTPVAVGRHSAKILISDGGLVGSYGAEVYATCLPIPTLSQLTALPATDIGDDTFTANWEAAEEEIDEYIVNLTTYDELGNIVDSEQYTTDGTNYIFERQPGYTYTYTVQSSRLGYTSIESNVITIDATGISGLMANRPASLLPIEGGVIVKCSEPLTDVAIYNTAGQLVRHLPVVENDATIELPHGVYIMHYSHCRGAVKMVVR